MTGRFTDPIAWAVGLLVCLLRAGVESDAVTAVSGEKLETDIHVEPIQCRVDPISAMTTFEAEYRRAVSEDEADIRFVPGGSQRAMTYVDPRSHRVTTMVNVSSMATDCPDTIRLMARHEVCHVLHDAARLANDAPLTPMERMHMEMQAGACALDIKAKE